MMAQGGDEMTILQSDEVTGVEYQDVKPNSKARMLKVFEQIAKDQTALYKIITDIDAPQTASSPQASGHDHSVGAPISIPLVNQVLKIALAAQTITPSNQWQVCSYIPFFVPAGVSEVRIEAIFSTKEAPQNFRFTVMDNSDSKFSGSRSINNGEEDNSTKFEYFNVDEDEVNLLRIEGWLSNLNNGGGAQIQNCILQAIAVLPFRQANSVQSFTQFEGNDSANFPDSAQYDGEYFTSFDDLMFSDDSALSSYILNSCALNDALLAEILHGQRASSMSSSTFAGHNHGENTTNLDFAGAAVQHALGSWSYGAGLGGNLGMYTPDQIAANDWEGRCLGITLLDTCTTLSIFARHTFLFPYSKQSRYSSGTSFLNCSVLLYLDHGKSGDVTIQATLRDSDLTIAGTSKTVVETGTGRQLVNLDGLEMPLAVPVGGEGSYLLELKAKQEFGVDEACLIYGACIYLR